MHLFSLLLFIGCTTLCVQAIYLGWAAPTPRQGDIAVPPMLTKSWRRVDTCPCVNFSTLLPRRADLVTQAIFIQKIHLWQLNRRFSIFDCTILCAQVITFDYVMRSTLWGQQRRPAYDWGVASAHIPCRHYHATNSPGRPRRSGHISFIIYFTYIN